MFLTGADDQALELTVVGYQYPAISSGGWDANWLVVRGRVRDGKREWGFTDPCLTTWELVELLKWLAEVGQHTQSIPSLRFTEPCLAFSFEARPTPALSVTLSHEAACPWGEGSGTLTRLVFALALNDPDAIQGRRAR